MSKAPPTNSVVQVHAYFNSGVSFDDYRRLRQETGVHEVYVSIITGRCGSTYLAHLCNQVGFGLGEEIFNEAETEVLDKLCGRNGFDKLLRLKFTEGVRNNRFYFQIDPIRLDGMARLLPGNGQPFPGVNQFTLIMRRNIVAQALSFYYAQATGIWHSDRAAAEKLNSNFVFAPRLVMQWIRQIHEMERRIVSMFAGFPPPTFYYEDLVCSTAETMVSFFKSANFNVDAEKLVSVVASGSGTRKLVRDQSLNRYAMVIDHYPWLEKVLDERRKGNVPSQTLNEMLMTIPD